MWVDASCLAADSGNVINAMQFATSRKCQLTVEQSAELEKLLGALVSVSGSKTQLGDDEEGKNEQKPDQTEDKKEEETKMPTTNQGTTGAGTALTRTPMKTEAGGIDPLQTADIFRDSDDQDDDG